jgi:hypothetical protein
MEASSQTPGIPVGGGTPDAPEGANLFTTGAVFGTALKFLGTIALLVFAFVILNVVGDALSLAAKSLSLDLPNLVTSIILIVGYGLQVFAAVWFIGIAVGFWNFFVGQDSTIRKA